VILHNERQEGFPITSLRELGLLRRVDHENVVKVKDMVVGRGRDGIFISMDLCQVYDTNMINDMSWLVDGLGYDMFLLLPLLRGECEEIDNSTFICSQPSSF